MADDDTTAKSDETRARSAMPALDFSTFILSLGSSCAVHLGNVPGPDGEIGEPNIPAAKQVLDILGILEDKTRGNLDESEAKLLGTLLYDLRVKFVDARKNARENAKKTNG